MISSDGSSSDEIDLGALWEVLWRYRYVIVTSVVVCAATATFVALTMKEMYRSEVVMTEVRNNLDGAGSLVGQLGGLASLAGVNLGANAPGREYKAFLQSRGLVEEFIKRNSLLAEINAGSTLPSTMWLGVKKFRDSILSIREDTRRGTTTVAVTWTDPETAARWANEFVALVNESMRERAMRQAKNNIAYLNDQIAGTDIVELRRVMYSLIETETKALMLANVRVEYAFEVVDAAVPPEIRVRPVRSLIVGLGGLAGLLIGAAVAFVLNAMRRKSAA